MILMQEDRCEPSRHSSLDCSSHRLWQVAHLPGHDGCKAGPQGDHPPSAEMFAAGAELHGGPPEGRVGADAAQKVAGHVVVPGSSGLIFKAVTLICTLRGKA